MNKKDRKRVSDMLEQIEGIASELEEMGEAEQEKYDNLPEGLQDSEQGENIQQAADYLQDAASELNDWIDNTRTNLEV